MTQRPLLLARRRAIVSLGQGAPKSRLVPTIHSPLYPTALASTPYTQVWSAFYGAACV